MKKFLNTQWYNYPNCVTRYTKEYENEREALIGIVTVQDTDTKEIKRYIGIGNGKNQYQDTLKILEIGIPFYGTI